MGPRVSSCRSTRRKARRRHRSTAVICHAKEPVGSASHTGRVTAGASAVSALETPLLRQIKNLGYLITAAVGVVGVLVFAYGYGAHWTGLALEV